MMEKMANPYEVFDVIEGNSKRQLEVAKLEKEAAADLAESWRWLFDDRRGRRLAWFILNRCGVFTMSFTGRASQTDFNEGQRNVGNWIMNRVLEDPGGVLVKMLKEQDDERAERARRSK